MNLDFDFENMTDEEYDIAIEKIESRIEEVENQIDYLRKREDACGFDKHDYYEEQELREELERLNSYL